MTTVSIAMATYNGARFISNQLESLKVQSLCPFELIVCDDGSSDDTMLIVNDFAATAPFPVRMHVNERRLGYRANFMQAAASCQGDLIAFCDQDDIWHEQKLALVSRCFENNNVDFVFHDYWLINANGKQIKFPGTRADISLFKEFSIIPGLTQVFRRKFLAFEDLWKLSVDPQKPSEPLAHDQWFFFIAVSNKSIHYCSTPLLGYRQHDDNTYGIRDAVSRKSDSLASTDGVSAESSLKRSLTRKRALVLAFLEGRKAASDNRAMLLDLMRRRNDSEINANEMEQLIITYEQKAALLSRRCKIYTACNVWQRARQVVLALRFQTYDLSIRGAKDLMLDLFLSILGAPGHL